MEYRRWIATVALAPLGFVLSFYAGAFVLFVLQNPLDYSPLEMALFSLVCILGLAGVVWVAFYQWGMTKSLRTCGVVVTTDTFSFFGILVPISAIAGAAIHDARWTRLYRWRRVLVLRGSFQIPSWPGRRRTIRIPDKVVEDLDRLFGSLRSAMGRSTKSASASG